MARILPFLFAFFFTSVSFGQSANFTIKSPNSDPFEGCSSYLVEFQAVIPGSSSIDSVEMISGDRSQILIDDNEWTISGRRYTMTIALNTGTYNPILRVKSGPIWNETILAKAIKVHSPPTASFELTSDSLQCFEGNNFTFKNTSTLGSSNSALLDGVIDYGDGNIGRGVSVPSKSYKVAGTFDVVYTVVDEKGCNDVFVAKDLITLQKPVGADFRAVGPAGCGKASINFTNRSTVAINDIASWEWHWEPGVVQSFTSANIATDWASYQRTYTSDGYFSPKLVVHTTYGCSDSIEIKDAIRNTVLPDLDFTINNSSAICVGDSVQFTMKDSSDFNQILWQFGDPTSQEKNVNRTDRKPVHQFNTPGSFPITLSISKNYCPAKDTTLCCVHVNGTKAMIDLPEASFQRSSTYLKGELEYMNNHSDYKSSVQRIDYYEKVPGKHYVGGTMTTFETTRSFSGNAGAQKVGNYQITLPTIGSVFYDYDDSLEYTTVAKTWFRGTPIPSAVMYVSPLSTDPIAHRLLTDTIKFADPALDSLIVDFPNFSTKRRIDASFGDNTFNIPAYYDDYPFLNGYHPDLNPSYPFASDSLEFFWDFDDDIAAICTSTVASPNSYCRYSTEKLPQHIFTKKGCFNVALTAKDPVTGCSNTTYQAIIYTEPKAGYDETLYSKMDWYEQNELLAANTPIEGMGLRLEGLPCVVNDLSLYSMKIVTDGLTPSCGAADANAPLNISFIGDAEEGCSTKVYIRDNNGVVIDSTYRNCSWIDGTTLKLIGNKWAYAIPGWKTVGVVVNSGNFRRDTFFYKDYIYFADVNVDFELKTISPIDSLTQKWEFHTEMLNQNDRALDSLEHVRFSISQIATTEGKGLRPQIKVYADSLQLQSNGFVDLTDTLQTSLSPGKYRVQSNGASKKGCQGLQAREVIVGHLSSFRVKSACVGLATEFVDSVYYWDKRGTGYCEMINWWENTTCIDTNNFFKNPDSTRKTWVQNLPGYQLPQFTEQIAWDYDNDGVIDDVNPKTPSFVYQQPGVYTCAMWSMDSTGYWFKNTRTFTVTGITLSASLETGQSSYICTPTLRTIHYEATVVGDTSFRVQTPTTTFVNQKKGSFNQPFYNRTPYALSIIGSTSSGCVDTLVDSTFFTFIGPRAEFSIQNDNICPGENLVATHTGTVTGQYEWRIASPTNGGAVITRNTRDLDEDLSASGLYQISLTTSESVTDPQTNQIVTCTAVFPEDNPYIVKNVETLDADFKIDERLSGERITFEITDFDPSNNYSYKIDSARINIPRSSGSKFTAQFSGIGDYTICVYVSDSGCTDSSCKTIWVDNVGINEGTQEALNVFPNPAQSEITILGMAIGSTYQISNLLGKTFVQGVANTTQMTLPVNDLSDGIYLLTIEQAGVRSTQKVVIER